MEQFIGVLIALIIGGIIVGLLLRLLVYVWAPVVRRRTREGGDTN